jgi:hypothetical protein
LRLVRNVVVLKYLSVCGVNLYQQQWREIKLLFQQRFCLLENVSHNAWLVLHFIFMCLVRLIKARMSLTFLCNWSAYVHMYLYNVIQPGQSTVCKCANTHKLLEDGTNIGFWVLSVVLAIVFLFRDWCGT